jgi:hypothetical protein
MRARGWNPQKLISYMGRVLLHPGTMATLLIAILIKFVNSAYVNTVSRLEVIWSEARCRARSPFVMQDKLFQSLDYVYDNDWVALLLNKSSGGMIHVLSDGVNRGKGPQMGNVGRNAT